jgi:dipeptide/tripeptide permease
MLTNLILMSAGSVAGFTAEQVEEVRMVVRMFPIFLTTIFYWTIYSQASALSLLLCSGRPVWVS